MMDEENSEYTHLWSRKYLHRYMEAFQLKIMNSETNLD